MALIRDVDRGVIRRDWRIISMVFAELLLLALIALQAWAILGVHVDFFLKQVYFKPNTGPGQFIVLGIALVAFALLYFAIKKRQPLLFSAQKEAPSMIRMAAREKLRNAREDPRAPALLLIDFMFVAIVVLAIVAYFDPELELIPWSAVGLAAPYTTVINAVIAVIVLGLFYYMYRYTADYRRER
jgi:hypothetical protein